MEYPPSGIVREQHVTAALKQQSRVLRHTMTHEERLLWPYLRANQLGGWHFRRQQIIDGYIVDFYCHRATLVVEVDGGVHRAHRAYDAIRDDVLSARGLRVLHITNEQVQCDLPGVLDIIRRMCEEAKG